RPTPEAVRATGYGLASRGVLMLLAWHPGTSRGLTPPTLAGHRGGGYHWCHERCHAYPVRHRAGRPLGRGAALAVGLRRAAPTRGPEAGPGTTRPDPASDRAGARGVPAAGGRRAGAALEQPRPLLRRRRGEHAPHPGGRRAPETKAKTRWATATSRAGRTRQPGRGPRRRVAGPARSPGETGG